MADNVIPLSLFVDFMYAAVVGATIVRIDPVHLYTRNIEFWGIWFLIAVFVAGCGKTRFEALAAAGFLSRTGCRAQLELCPVSTRELFNIGGLTEQFEGDAVAANLDRLREV